MHIIFDWKTCLCVLGRGVYRLLFFMFSVLSRARVDFSWPPDLVRAKQTGANPQQEEVKLCHHSFLEDFLTHLSFLYLRGIGCVVLLPALSSAIYFFILYNLLFLFYFVHACCIVFKKHILQRALWRRPAGGDKHDIIYIHAWSVVLLRRVS